MRKHRLNQDVAPADAELLVPWGWTPGSVSKGNNCPLLISCPGCGSCLPAAGGGGMGRPQCGGQTEARCVRTS